MAKEKAKTGGKTLGDVEALGNRLADTLSKVMPKTIAGTLT